MASIRVYNDNDQFLGLARSWGEAKLMHQRDLIGDPDKLHRYAGVSMETWHELGRAVPCYYMPGDLAGGT